MRLPNFVIVGAVKCGTTSLYEYLRQHPEVFMCARKEPNFFADASNRNRVREEQYHALFAKAQHEKAVGEASVTYLYSPGAAESIHAYLGSATRIVIMLRNPVDMAYSLWGHMVRAGGERLGFVEALEAEPRRMRDERFRREAIGWIHSYAYVSRGRYAEQVERYLRRFGAAQVKVCLFEEFFRDPQQGFADVCRFLAVSDTFAPDFKVHNPTGPVISTLLRDVVNERRTWKEPFKALAPRSFRRWLKTRIYWWNRWNHVPLPRLDPEVREVVWALFEPDVRKLEAVLGRSLRNGVWGPGRAVQAPRAAAQATAS